MRLLLTLAAMLVLSQGIGCNPKTNAPGKNPGGEDHSIAVKAADLSDEFEQDQAAADKKYQGKTLIVEGEVDLIQSIDDEVHRLVLKGTARPPVAGGNGHPIECIFDPQEADKLDKLSPTQTVTVTGQYKGADGLFVNLIDCRLGKTGPNPAMAVTATELAQAFVLDGAGAKAKYQGKWVVVEGKFRVVKGLESEIEVVLDGFEKDGKATLVNLIGDLDANETLRAIPLGESVRFKGLCIGLLPTGKVEIRSARLMK